MKRQIGMIMLVFWAYGMIPGSTNALYAQDGKTKTVKVLTIGNSFADNATTYLEQMAESIPGYEIEVIKANISSCSLEKHANLISACQNDPALQPYYDEYCLRDLLTEAKLDFVTIQQVSLLSWKPESFQPHADILIQFIRENAPQAEILVHQIWAYDEDGARYKDWGITKNEMHEKLVNSYDGLASEYGLRILPAGEAFYASYKKDPDINLWKSDNYHANMYGCYLAGAVWLGQMLEVSPTKIDFIPEGMDSKTAQFLQKIAKSTIKKANKRK